MLFSTQLKPLICFIKIFSQQKRWILFYLFWTDNLKREAEVDDHEYVFVKGTKAPYRRSRRAMAVIAIKALMQAEDALLMGQYVPK